MTRPQLTDDELQQLEDARALAQMRRVRDAFLAVFGEPGKRTPYGAVILEHLERKSRWRDPNGICVMDSHGHTDIFRTGAAEGRRWMVQAIHDAIEWRETHGNTGSAGA